MFNLHRRQQKTNIHGLYLICITVSRKLICH